MLRLVVTAGAATIPIPIFRLIMSGGTVGVFSAGAAGRSAFGEGSCVGVPVRLLPTLDLLLAGDNALSVIVSNIHPKSNLTTTYNLYSNWTVFISNISGMFEPAKIQ